MFGCKENISDMLNRSVKDEPILGHTTPHEEHRSVVVSTTSKSQAQLLPHKHFQECRLDMHGTKYNQQQECLMGGISQMCTKANFYKKGSQKSLQGEFHLPMHRSTLVNEKGILSNEDTTIQVVSAYVSVCHSSDTNDACKIFGYFSIPQYYIYMHCSSHCSFNYQFLECSTAYV
jgi:hypothetical protein